ncbi:MAG: hypothetical protein AMK73_05780 [Planctomycetes bacterium SM23_32]|nr:MAG: hypothetical protein AMK73_05780 [Planctomycetes bacterium SM23_32]
MSWREVLRAAQRNAEGELLVCPCCGGSFRRFLPAGGRRKVPNRKCPGCGSLERHRAIWLYMTNRTCPGCGSLERHRAIWLYMTNRTNLGRGPIRMLHFAPRPCLQKLLEAMPEVDYVTADLDSPRAALRMDLTDILFRDEVFDAVLCVHVLEHVQDDRRAMREVWRVLKPGGWAVLHSPVDRTREATLEDPGIVSPEDRERLYGQWDHVRAYGRDYARRLAEAGFEVTCDDYLRGLGLEAARRHRLGSELDIYFCVKQGAKAGHAGRL